MSVTLPEAVAAADSVTWVELSTLDTVAPDVTPVPHTGMPASRFDVLEIPVTTAEPEVVVPVSWYIRTGYSARRRILVLLPAR